MRIKKVVSFALVVTMLFALAISTFAESRSLNGGNYSAGTVKHQFNTSATATKSSSQSWSRVTDNSLYSYYYKEDDPDTTVEGSHYTYLVDASGSKLTSKWKEVKSGKAAVFTTEDMDKNSNSNTVKLQIHNTEYSKTKRILKTNGILDGIAL